MVYNRTMEKPMNNLYKIGELSKETGASIDTIRFYEDKGLLTPKSRSESGYRYYGKIALHTLSFIQSAKELGFTLSEIKELLEIQVLKGGKCSLTLEKIKAKENDVDRKIQELKKIKKALRKVSEKCEQSDANQSCHFLELIRGNTRGK
ncbi:MAG: hypothetical protein COW00_13500 [Bdellovibrio sp. CG12_big_fil_rev_8_21_14_0_65_39_13]|nr:MAG: hypothetical protein COW00_13500 [Bdellovibrio sp. CG12_big_fil_rev_8_21_14_0_65_39_13]PIR34590.1 MAG: hypothetical protein COV37_12510 [Bdellovibrio sp. CG11_big_fil_rev_8_21_14_0_20_39_38]